ncbi:uncharacterized protein LOC126771890 [Nymphalis io]|uniref:uncharacterized protein LOC126771890 n=1 Tax=Inachis io TaxID=171585 RepID=UPI0021678D51|nr:uncharacterized protein LOC126771890 [Nymphalis io]
MSYLCKISVVFCLLFTFMISCSESNKDAKIAFPIFDVSRFCFDRSVFARSRKIICLLCKGFDPSCFQYSTSTTSTSPKTTTRTTTPNATIAQPNTPTEIPATKPTTEESVPTPAAE